MFVKDIQEKRLINFLSYPWKDLFLLHRWTGGYHIWDFFQLIYDRQRMSRFSANRSTDGVFIEMFAGRLPAYIRDLLAKAAYTA